MNNYNGKKKDTNLNYKTIKNYRQTNNKKN